MIRCTLLSCNASVKIIATVVQGCHFPIDCRPFKLLSRPIQEQAWWFRWPGSAGSSWKSCRTLTVKKKLGHLDDQQKSMQFPQQSGSRIDFWRCVYTQIWLWCADGSSHLGRKTPPALEDQSCSQSLDLPRWNFAFPGWWVRPGSRKSLCFYSSINLNFNLYKSIYKSISI